MQTIEKPSAESMATADKILSRVFQDCVVDVHGGGSSKGLCSYIARLLDSRNASPQIADETEQRATVIVGERAYDVPKEVGAALMQARAALRMVNDDYDDTGCDGMGTISSETIEHVRRVIGQ
jgi:predicted alternative tryptophan synthase beta-subunit